MANILTAAEASIVLRCETTDSNMLAILPSIDAYIKRATGRDWAADSVICDEAKSAARMLLVQWHENPGMVGSDPQALGFGLSACLSQLETMALHYIEFYGRDGSGAVALPRAYAGSSIDTLVGLIGATGDQKAKFEAVISEEGYIEQIADEDLSDVMYRVHLKPPSEL